MPSSAADDIEILIKFCSTLPPDWLLPFWMESSFFEFRFVFFCSSAGQCPVCCCFLGSIDRSTNRSVCCYRLLAIFVCLLSPKFRSSNGGGIWISAQPCLPSASGLAHFPINQCNRNCTFAQNVVCELTCRQTFLNTNCCSNIEFTLSLVLNLCFSFDCRSHQSVFFFFDTLSTILTFGSDNHFALWRVLSYLDLSTPTNTPFLCPHYSTNPSLPTSVFHVFNGATLWLTFFSVTDSVAAVSFPVFLKWTIWFDWFDRLISNQMPTALRESDFLRHQPALRSVSTRPWSQRMLARQDDCVAVAVNNIWVQLHPFWWHQTDEPTVKCTSSSWQANLTHLWPSLLIDQRLSHQSAFTVVDRDQPVVVDNRHLALRPCWVGRVSANCSRTSVKMFNNSTHRRTFNKRTTRQPPEQLSVEEQDTESSTVLTAILLPKRRRTTCGQTNRWDLPDWPRSKNVCIVLLFHAFRRKRWPKMCLWIWTRMNSKSAFIRRLHHPNRLPRSPFNEPSLLPSSTVVHPFPLHPLHPLHPLLHPLLHPTKICHHLITTTSTNTTSMLANHPDNIASPLPTTSLSTKFDSSHFRFVIDFFISFIRFSSNTTSTWHDHRSLVR